MPEGFSVARVADDTLAHDLWCLTLDEQGRIVVGGPGYIKRLEDTDGDGKADKQSVFADHLHLPIGFELTLAGCTAR